MIVAAKTKQLFKPTAGLNTSATSKLEKYHA